MTVFSKQNKVLFVHVPKTGGSSVLKFLRKRISWDDYDYQLAKHATVFELKKRLGKWFENSFKFSIVRNPWERVASAYYFKLTHPPIVEPCSFEQFVLTPETLICKRSNGTTVPLVEQPVLKSHSYFLYNNDQLCVDRILRFETLEDDWNALCRERDWTGGYEALPRTNQQDRSRYKGMYTSELEEVVATRYRDDIERLNYSFPLWMRG